MYKFTLDPSLYLADQYFAKQMQKVWLLNRYTGDRCDFYQHRQNAGGGYCYFLSALALMGLKETDLRVCGTIDTIPVTGYRENKNYQHAWVEFETGEGLFVYDPLTEHIIPKDVYYGICNPREITSEVTLAEMLDTYLTDKYAYRITDNVWQFKAKRDAFKRDENNDKFIFSALQKGHLTGYFENDHHGVIIFIADEPRYYY